MSQRTGERGQTLIEVLLVTGVIALLLTSLVSVMITSVARNRLGQERSIAARLGQESIEWLRGERNRLGWNEFVVKVGTVASEWCLVDSNAELDTLSGVYATLCDTSINSDHLIQDKYWRNIHLDYQPAAFPPPPAPATPAYYTVQVTVDWLGNDGAPIVLNTELAEPI